MNRYPIGPLLAALNIDPTVHGAPRQLAQALRIDKRNACRLIRRGGFSGRSKNDADILADRYANTIGKHPSQLWPEWWTNLDSDEALPGWFVDDDEPAEAAA